MHAEQRERSCFLSFSVPFFPDPLSYTMLMDRRDREGGYKGSQSCSASIQFSHALFLSYDFSYVICINLVVTNTTACIEGCWAILILMLCKLSLAMLARMH